MYAKESTQTAVDNAAQWKAIECLYKHIVHIRTILMYTFLLEVEVRCHDSTLVITSKKIDSLGELKL